MNSNQRSMSHATNVLLPNGTKYAMLVVRHALQIEGDASYVDLGGGRWVGKGMPFPMPSHWQEWLGKFAVAELDDRGMYLLCSAPSRTLDVLDSENKVLLDFVYRWFLSVNLLGYWQFRSRPRLFSGSVRDSGVDIHSSSQEPGPTLVRGVSPRRLTPGVLARAALLTDALAGFDLEYRGTRFQRVINAYASALFATDLGEKLHQFVRAIDGIFVTEQGHGKAQFKERFLALVSPDLQEKAETLYRLRSDFEHLRRPTYSIDEQPEGSDQVKYSEYAVLAELAAKHVIVKVLETPEQWPVIADDSRLRRYWRDWESEASAWGERITVQDVERCFVRPRTAQPVDPGSACTSHSPPVPPPGGGDS